MRCTFLRSKALFMIQIIIISLFSVYFLNPSVVYAQPVTATDTQNACCEKTTAGETCRYTLESNCEPSYRIRPFQSCEQTDFCKVGCCVSTEGLCSKQVPKAICDEQGFTWNPDANCNIESCTKGCCVLGESSCLYSTESRCDNILQNYPELEKDYQAVDSELGCTDICRAADRGCCVNEDSCTYTARGTCGLSDGTGQDGFYNEVFCSNENLNCDCQPHFRKGCVEGEEDVSWFDSCGNPEDIASDCNYDQGTLCSEADPQHEEAYCRSVNCASTTKNINLKTQEPIDDYTGVTRKNGESWCLYDGAVGPSLDLVGSRHFRTVCANAEELVEPCKDYREEYCMQADLTGTPLGNYREANCISNEWDECGSCNSALEIVFDPALNRRGQEELLGEIETATEVDRSCCIAKNGCAWQGDNTSGVCTPFVPPGFELTQEERDEGSDANQQCSIATRECKAIWENSADTGGWKCIAGCECLTEEYITGGNNFCRSLGDCGAHFNYLGEWSDSGFFRVHDDLESEDMKYGSFYNEDHPPQPNFDEFMTTSDDGLSLGNLEWDLVLPAVQQVVSTQILDRINERTIGIFSNAGRAGDKAVLIVTLAHMIFQGSALGTTVAGIVLMATRGSVRVAAAVGAGIGVAAVGLGYAISQLLIAAGAMSSIPYAGWVAGAIILVITAILAIIALYQRREQVTVQFTCAPWEPPRGPRAGEDDTCKLCDQDPLKPCSKYRCNSIAQNCKFIPENEGSGRESCYNADPNDVQRPKIQPWNEVLKVVSQRDDVTEDYDLEIIPASPEFLGGFEIKDKVPPFAKVTFGIKTDEPAQCKIGEEFSNPLTYNPLPEFFQDSFYEREHNRTMGPLTPGKDYKLYVICVDPAGNDDTSPVPPYVIKFSTEDGPDLEAPFIVASSIPNGKVAANASTAIFSLFVDEVSPFMCKYSRQDLDYNLMDVNMSCASGPLDSLFQGYSECITQLNLTEGANNFYFRCQDNPENTEPNTNADSFAVTLTRTEPLLITQTAPSGELLTNNVTLQVATSNGADNGKAICSYDNGASMVGEFFQTDAAIHQQPFSGLPQGAYNFAVHCRDEVLNTADSSIAFTVTADTVPPQIAELYKSSGTVHVTLNEVASCQYANTTFTYGTGISSGENTKEHTLTGLNVYHLVCQDLFNNRMLDTVIYS